MKLTSKQSTEYKLDLIHLLSKEDVKLISITNTPEKSYYQIEGEPERLGNTGKVTILIEIQHT